MRDGYWSRGLPYPGNSYQDEAYCVDAPEVLAAGSTVQMPRMPAAGIFDLWAMPRTVDRVPNASFSREPERSVGESAGSDSYGGNDD